MIDLNQTYSFEKDKYGWKLHRYYDGRSKDKTVKRQKKTTYHANIEQVLGSVIDHECGRCESAEELLALLKSVNMLTWTKENPTKPGFYWKKENSDGVTSLSIVNLRENEEGHLCIFFSNLLRVWWDLPDNAEWAGPICEPIAGSYQSDGLDSNNIFE